MTVREMVVLILKWQTEKCNYNVATHQGNAGNVISKAGNDPRNQLQLNILSVGNLVFKQQ